MLSPTLLITFSYIKHTLLQLTLNIGCIGGTHGHRLTSKEIQKYWLYTFCKFNSCFNRLFICLFHSSNKVVSLCLSYNWARVAVLHSIWYDAMFGFMRKTTLIGVTEQFCVESRMFKCSQLPSQQGGHKELREDGTRPAA